MKKTYATSLSVLALVLVCTMVVFSGCSNSSSSSPAPAPAPAKVIASIAVTAPTYTAQIGNTRQFTATATYTDTTTGDITASAVWTSSATTVATISAAGVATAVQGGDTVISAASGTHSATKTLTVTNYKATLYMASEAGGHIGVFPVTIDPTNAANPITVDDATINRIQLKGRPKTATLITFHDVRLDGNKLYYSAFFSSGTATTQAHVGYVDLTAANTGVTNNAIDSTIDIDAPAADTIAFALNAMGVGSGLRAVYCGSGQTATHFLPMTMSFPAYIDAFPKSLIASANSHLTASTGAGSDSRRTYIEHIDADAAGWARINGSGGSDLGSPPLAFLHGNSSPDGTKMFVSTNRVGGLNPNPGVNLDGEFRFYTMNISDLIAGTMDPSKVISKASFSVATHLASIAYRSSWTPDGTKILQAGADRMLILNSSNLSLYVDTMSGGTGTIGGTKTGIENHDVMTTPDGKYAILAIRYFEDATQEASGFKTSGIQLYDINNKKFIGGMASTCGAGGTNATNICHPATLDTMGRLTCGIDGKWK